MSENVAELIRSLPNQLDRTASDGVNAVFHLHIVGDRTQDWCVTIRDRSCSVEEGACADPDATFHMSEGDFLKMMAGKLPGRQAFFSGQLRVTGDLDLAERFESFFGR